MSKSDPRLTPARPDLAASHLRGKYHAERYVDGELRQVRVGHCNLHSDPRHDEGLDTQLHFGQVFRVFDEQEGWAWGQAELDGYVGYVPSSALSTSIAGATHRVSTLRTLVYPGPSMKLIPTETLSLNAEVVVSGEKGGFAETQVGFVPTRHLRPKDHLAQDVVDTAVQFLGVPYLWGGRTSLGIDCSGLIQEAFLSAGEIVARDTDLQEKSIGERINPDNSLMGLERGDLVFWDRHVGIMKDAKTLVHANAFHMSVEAEPVSHAVERIMSAEGPVTSIRRWKPD